MQLMPLCFDTKYGHTEMQLHIKRAEHFSLFLVLKQICTSLPMEFQDYYTYYNTYICPFILRQIDMHMCYIVCVSLLGIMTISNTQLKNE